jgi:hypothetical protein
LFIDQLDRRSHHLIMIERTASIRAWRHRGSPRPS